eukprot:CAMPEP_0119310864 /NCGR_PEP_ID=MMETSP1333-20130426/20591_1 /TAXON_ID=418940 /ORGANISM="Scyphosphaera apsteinii, Strain RCC1455" /LENGTH=160 /DNA_ID=CAMNT_0007315125 /DNA_START=78 /DNA_END=560 /DNA_ORIENTATION=+
MILSEAGAKYEVKDPSEAPKGIGFTVPMVTFPAGYTVAQQGAIAASLGKELGFYPKTAEGEALALNIVENMMDMVGELGKGDDRLTKWYGTFEAALAKSGSGFLVGDTLTYADLASYKIVKLATEKGGTAGPLLAKWLEMMATTKGAKAVDGLGLPMMPS